jgi:hypothetical protein
MKLEFTFKLPDMKTGQCLHLALKFPEVLVKNIFHLDHSMVNTKMETLLK